MAELGGFLGLGSPFQVTERLAEPLATSKPQLTRSLPQEALKRSLFPCSYERIDPAGTVQDPAGGRPQLGGGCPGSPEGQSWAKTLCQLVTSEAGSRGVVCRAQELLRLFTSGSCDLNSLFNKTER